MVNRYRLLGFDSTIEPSSDGEYVKWADYAALEAQLAALPEPDMVSMSEGTIHLDYEDDGARREAYEWLERYAYSSAPEAQQEAARIGDAVLDWMIKYDLLDGDQEYYVHDVLAVLNDLTPSTRPSEQAVTEANTEWQPIETAPRDGREILMWSESMGMAVWPSTAKWDHVTHWMPLPEPPAAAMEAKE